MSDNDVYLVKLQVRFNPTKESRVNETKISSKSDRRFLARSVQVEIMMKNSRYCMFSLLRLFFVFYGEIYVKNGYGFVCFWSHNIYSFALSAAKVPLGQCSRVSLL